MEKANGICKLFTTKRYCVHCVFLTFFRDALETICFEGFILALS